MSSRQRRIRAANASPEALAALADLSSGELKDRWGEVYGRPPPLRLGRNLMIRGIAYRLQELAFGGLDAATRKRLHRIADEHATANPSATVPAQIKPDTRLLREWHGVTHEVIVLEKGVEYRGRQWSSLSAVARDITGARWSGPAFFGLKGRRDGGR